MSYICPSRYICIHTFILDQMSFPMPSMYISILLGSREGPASVPGASRDRPGLQKGQLCRAVGAQEHLVHA
jgi:hypothetical protein